MQTRGSVIKSIDQFVADTHPDQYQKWRDKLPDATSKLLSSPISTSKWYPVDEGVIIPTQVFCQMFYGIDQKRGAWQSGRYAAEMALTGIYKVFVLVSSPSFILKRASRVFSTFFDPADLTVAESSDNHAIIRSIQLPAKNSLIENRMAGWMEKALEICGCNGLSVRITKSIDEGDHLFEVSISWD